MEQLNRNQIKAACVQLGIDRPERFRGILTTIKGTAEDYKKLADRTCGGGHMVPCCRGFMVFWLTGIYLER